MDLLTSGRMDQAAAGDGSIQAGRREVEAMMDTQEFIQLLARVQQDHRVGDARAGLLRNSFIRTINYHSTAAVDKDSFDKQLAFLSRHFSPVTVEDVDLWLDSGTWHKEKPGLILAVFEGFRNHFDVFYPLLQKYGMIGWFHIPAFFPDVPVKDQLEYSKEHHLRVVHEDEYPDGRHAMTWDEIRQISRDHVLCCHSGTHFQIMLDTPEDVMKYEIVDSKKRIESMTGRECPVFCWLYGEEYSYNPRAAVHVQSAGYRYVIGNLKMERVGRKGG